MLNNKLLNLFVMILVGVSPFQKTPLKSIDDNLSISSPSGLWKVQNIDKAKVVKRQLHFSETNQNQMAGIKI